MGIEGGHEPARHALPSKRSEGVIVEVDMQQKRHGDCPRHNYLLSHTKNRHTI